MTPVKFNYFRASSATGDMDRRSMHEPRPDRRFPTTHWSIVARLRSSDDREAENAVQEVFTSYRYPLYAYLRACRLRHEDAEDVLQGFFEKMLRTHSLATADQERGRLRTFLLTALSRFRINWQRGEQRRHQRVDVESNLWGEDEARYQREQHATHETPETFFERRWALELIERVRQRLREHYEKSGKPELHAALAPLVSGQEPEPGSFASSALKLGMTENALRVSLSRLRRDFRELLLQEVKRTLDEDGDAKAEIRHLLGLFER